MEISNQTLKELCVKHRFSSEFYKKTHEINIICALTIIPIGIISSLLAILVFSKKKNRSSSTSVYLVCLCTSNGLFLVTHFFEDTIKSLIETHNIHDFIHPICSTFTQKYPKFILLYLFSFYFLFIS